MTLGEFIKQYRARMGISQRTFAQQCNLSHAYIGFLEKGVNPSTGEPIKPSLLNLHKIAKAMGIKLDDLLGEVDDMVIMLDGGAIITKDKIEETFLKRSKGKESPEELLLRVYRDMDPDGQQRLIEQATMLYEKYRKE